MPVSIGDLNWSQDNELIKIRIKLIDAVSVNNLDVFTHAEYIKLNSPPFYREFFLHKPIDASRSKCRIADRCVYFELKKKEPGHWDELEFNLVDKSERKSRKEQIVDAHQRQEQEALDERLQRKQDVKRKDMLTEIDRLNEESKRQEEKVQLIREEIKLTPEAPKIADQPKKIISIPGIRQPGTITVNFTDRSFPTPKRESQINVEDNWLEQQTERKRLVGFVEEDLRDEEKDPLWLLAKGNEFFGHQNYLGAISAFTTGIKLDPHSIELHYNRGEAQFREKNFMRCAEDYSKAIELLDKKKNKRGEESDEDRKLRIKCLARRGAALCKMGLIGEGWGEIHSAWQLDKSNESLKHDLDEISKRLSVQL